MWLSSIEEILPICYIKHVDILVNVKWHRREKVRGQTAFSYSGLGKRQSPQHTRDLYECDQRQTGQKDEDTANSCSL